MVTRLLSVTSRLGLHARPAALLVQTASQFKSRIMVSKGGTEVNGKSVMGIMLLAAEHGAKIKVSVSGPDEKEAMAALERLFVRKFDED